MKPCVVVLKVNVLPSKLWINFWIGLAQFYVTIPFIKLILPFIKQVSKSLIQVRVVERSA